MTSSPPARSDTTGDCWFRLPPGYLDIDLDGLEDLRERLLTMPSLFALAPADWDRHRHATEALLHLLEDGLGQGLMYAALGLHMQDSAETCVSVLTLSDVDSGAPTPSAAAAQCGLHMVTRSIGSVQQGRFVELPCASPAALSTALLPAPSDAVMASTGLPKVNGEVFHARLTIARPHGPRVVIIDLTTTAVSVAEEYTDILLGVGRTVSFVDPASPPRDQGRPSRLLELFT
jgi:hypothetical protein